jgi:hypothetical protein
VGEDTHCIDDAVALLAWLIQYLNRSGAKQGTECNEGWPIIETS